MDLALALATGAISFPAQSLKEKWPGLGAWGAAGILDGDTEGFVCDHTGEE